MGTTRFARTLRWTSLIALIGAGAVGCSGGDGGGSSTPASFLFFTHAVPVDSVTAGLWAVNPQDPNPEATRIEHLDFEAPLLGLTLVDAGSWGGTRGIITSVHTRWVVYAKDDGTGFVRLYRLNALASTTVPVPEQVGDLPAGCGADVGGIGLPLLRAFTDHADPANGLVAWRSAGDDTTCGSTDDVVTLIPIGAAATTTGAALPAGASVLGVARSAASGAIERVLAVQGGALWSCGLDAVCETVLDAADPQLVAEWAGKTWLIAEGALRFYDAATNELGSPPGEPITPGVLRALDGTRLFYTDGTTIFSLALDGATAPAAVHTVPEGQFVGSVLLSTNRIVFPAAGAVWSVPKAGGDAAPLLTGTPTQTFVSETSIYFTLVDGVALMNEDGTGREDIETPEDSSLSWRFVGGDTIRTGGRRSEYPRYLVLENVDADAQTITLTGYDGPSRRAAGTVGTIYGAGPEGSSVMMIEGSADATLMLSATVLGGTAAMLELRLVEAARPDSLRLLAASTAYDPEFALVPMFVGTPGCESGGGAALSSLALVLGFLAWRVRFRARRE
jgi:hypothetical protein